MGTGMVAIVLGLVFGYNGDQKKETVNLFPRTKALPKQKWQLRLTNKQPYNHFYVLVLLLFIVILFALTWPV